MATRELIGWTPGAKRIAIGIATATLGVTACLGWRLSNARATPPPATQQIAPSAPATTATNATTAGPPPTTTEIIFTTVPSSYASVTWGKTLLGRITPHEALVVVRPRDSGPLDVVVRAQGYLPVHTRAHTFADTKIAVKLTRPDQKSTLFGYRAPIDAGTPEEEPVPPGTSVGGDSQPPP